VHCAREAAGTRYDTSGAKIGKAHLKWAFAAAAGLCLRDHPAAQKSLARVEHTHEKGQALTSLAQKLARAVYALRKRQGACDRETFCPRYTSREGSGGASGLTGHRGAHPQRALDTAASLASRHAKAPRGPHALSPAL
jgi:hypothetical protein